MKRVRIQHIIEEHIYTGLQLLRMTEHLWLPLCMHQICSTAANKHYLTLRCWKGGNQHMPKSR